MKNYIMKNLHLFACFVSFSNPGYTYLFRRLSFIILFTVLLWKIDYYGKL